MKKILLVGILLVILCTAAFGAEAVFGVGPRFGGGYHFSDWGQILGGVAFNVGWGFGGSTLGAEIDLFYFYLFDAGVDALAIPIFFRGSTATRIGYFAYGVGLEIDTYFDRGTEFMLLLMTGVGFNAGRGTIDLEFRFVTDFDYSSFYDYVALMVGYTFRF